MLLTAYLLLKAAKLLHRVMEESCQTLYPRLIETSQSYLISSPPVLRHFNLHEHLDLLGYSLSALILLPDDTRHSDLETRTSDEMNS